MRRLIVGLDPGSGSSSPTGVAVADPDTRSLLFASNIWSNAKEQSKRLYHFHEQVSDILGAIDPDLEVYVFVESFFIRGKGNTVLQQVIGALKAAVPERAYLADVPNTTVKRLVGGTGKADKAQVAAGVYKWAAMNEEAALAVHDLIAQKEFDVLDAFAIAIAGWEQHGPAFSTT